MNTSRNHSYNDPKHESLRVLIEQALQDMQNYDQYEHIEPSENLNPINNARDLFFAAVQSPWSKHPSSLSLIEQWANNASNLNWYEQAQSLLNSIGENASNILQSEIQNLKVSLETLSSNLVPAPAHRGPSAARMVYPSQRRSIPAADLPTFHPLFCTSVDPAEGPTRLAGLSMDSTYSCRFKSVADPEWQIESKLHAASSGGFKLDLEAVFTEAPQGDLAWIIEEDSKGGSNSAWISGLVWRAPDAGQSENVEYENASDALDWPWRRIKTLIEINRLYANEMFVEAYEAARCTLRTERAAPNDGSMVPFSEALWLMIEKSLDQMIARLKASQDVFQTLKPEWNALQPLLQLRQDISS